MKFLAFAALLAVSLPVQAQLYKCVDERGRTHYTDKPLPGCKGGAVKGTASQALAKPAKSTDKKAAKKAAKPVPKKTVLSAKERAYLASRCKTLAEERDWLRSPRGAGVASHTERLAQVEQALGACP